MTDQVFKPLNDFAAAWQLPSSSLCLSAIRGQAILLRQQLLQQPPVSCFKSADLYCDLYPIRQAYSGVYHGALLTVPYIHLLKRLWIIQFTDFNGTLKTLLFSPSDDHDPLQIALFQRFNADLPRYLRRLSKAVIAPKYQSVASALGDIGLRPEQVDYISYNHLQGQHIAHWLEFFPAAKLLVHEQELSNCAEQIPATRLKTFSGSVYLGDGLALIHSPGISVGHHVLAARVAESVCVITGNGVGADAYAPEHSRVRAVRRYARQHDLEVIVKGCKKTASDTHYVSMVMEKALAGSSHHPDFPNCAYSGEATPYWLMPGFTVSFLRGPDDVGEPQ
ncbi:MAG: hypothetical protein U0998_00890 [Moraxellaceae bacterium]|nr:hypothetical protein [Moraxellaceae bacterium]MDP1775158.1 hypothetical protein [Moraxellaceae bacterium]MDZ4298680.1 hypothetical protein [Moraxellaceae bacterium]MDZ4385757.1 hypothetical protein [Moraxellaceae bacterium]